MSPPSRFGCWKTVHGLPAFAYTADPTVLAEAEWDTLSAGSTRRHWLGIGNRRIQAFVDNMGTVALFDEHHGIRWLTAADPVGTGISWISEEGGVRWGSRLDARAEHSTPVRTFGPTWFRVEVENRGVKLERTVLCPEGEQPWLLIRVRLSAPERQAVRLKHVDEWALRPQYVNLGVAPFMTLEQQARVREYATRFVRYRTEVAPGVACAHEERQGDPAIAIEPSNAAEPVRRPAVFGPPVVMRLEALGGTAAQASHDGAPHPRLMLVSEVDLAPGEARDLWFRFGVDDGSTCDTPAALYESSLRALSQRLPSAQSTQAPMAEREVPWHAALLSGQACADAVLGGHTLNQGSAYSFNRGFNGAARDPLQHALPLVYLEPDLALSVLRNTCSWGAPDGKLPWCIDGAKEARTHGVTAGKSFDKPSDLSLWSLWLASEYAAATGDLNAFAEPLGFHPMHEAEPVPLQEHLRGHFRHLIERVGFGAHGHLRVLDCDWADGHLGEVQHGLDRATIVSEGESVLNSAMAAWVLPVWAGLCDRLADRALAAEAREVAERLRRAVANEWTGRWFRRARCRDAVVGEETLFLEVQPWAILCGAAYGERAGALLEVIDRRLRQSSPLGARQRWPIPTEQVASGAPGEALTGGIWPSLQMTLIWAAARHAPELAWDEWRRFTLASHTEAYPGVWEGTLSGPDSYNAPESPRAGRTHALGHFSMQQFPVNNLHAHAQPLIAYLRLLGVEPLADGSLQVTGGSGSFRSRTLSIFDDGSGSLEARGEIDLRTRSNRLRSGPGLVRWTQ